MWLLYCSDSSCQLASVPSVQVRLHTKLVQHRAFFLSLYAIEEDVCFLLWGSGWILECLNFKKTSNALPHLRPVGSFLRLELIRSLSSHRPGLLLFFVRAETARPT